MTRRIVRTISQLGALLVTALLFVFLVDTRYRLLPHAIHTQNFLHHPGLIVTDVTLTTCSSLNPLSSCQLDSSQWHRIEKDLYLHTGWVSSAYLHVQRKKEEELTADDKVVIDLRVGRLDPGVGEKGQQQERWESRPGNIWLLRSNKKKDSDSDRAVTAVDVLFGADAVDPRPGWSVTQTPLLLDAASRLQAARITIRHGPVRADKKDVIPRIRKDGKFKIIQLSDLHLSTGTGSCRDAIDANGDIKGDCEADPRTLDFVGRILDEEAPDLVVLGGDQVNGDTAPDAQSAIFKFADLLISRSIPYAAIFGNHDDEGPKATRLSREAQMSLLSTMPFSLSRPGPDNVDGVGNYYVEVLAQSPSQNSAVTLYFLDSHSYSPDEKTYRGYDWIKPNQIQWFTETAQSLKAQHAKYTHIHLDMAFIHIPLPEFAMQGNLVAGGEFREPSTAPGFNSGFYKVLKEQGIVSVGCGHDHVNDYCALTPQSKDAANSENVGPWMCYAGGSGFGGYAGYGGFHRRVRVWDLDMNAGRIVTWKRVECCGDDLKKRIGELLIVDGGRVVVQPDST
ncbi:Metallo-dependent phosphatase [Aureobasidium sp. EXF-12298]